MRSFFQPMGCEAEKVKNIIIFYRIRKGLNYEDANTGAVLYGDFFCCVDC